MTYIFNLANRVKRTCLAKMHGSQNRTGRLDRKPNPFLVWNIKKMVWFHNRREPVKNRSNWSKIGENRSKTNGKNQTELIIFIFLNFLFKKHFLVN